MLLQQAGVVPDLAGVTVGELRVPLDQLVVERVVVGTAGDLGAELGHQAPGRGQRLPEVPQRFGGRVLPWLSQDPHHLALRGEDDLLLVAEVAEERGAAGLGAPGDLVDGDLVEAALDEERERGLDDPVTGLAASAVTQGLRGHRVRTHRTRIVPLSRAPSRLGP